MRPKLPRAARSRGYNLPMIERAEWSFVLRYAVLCFALLCSGLLVKASAEARSDAISVQDLPSEARDVIARIRKGGPFPFRQDGIVFGNFEKRLPVRSRGYYHEYTVPTPGERTRGARRIIAGADGEMYYTGDHYRTFMRIIE